MPLAAKTLGSMVREKKTLKERENVLNSKLWEIEDIEQQKNIYARKDGKINPILVKKYKTYLGTLKIKEDLGLVDAKSLTQKIKNIYFKLLLSENSWIGNIISSIDDIYRKYKKREIIK